MEDEGLPGQGEEALRGAGSEVLEIWVRGQLHCRSLGAKCDADSTRKKLLQE